MANTATVEIIVKARDQTGAALGSVASQLEAMRKSATAASVVFGALSAAGAGLIYTITMTAARTEELGVVIDSMGRVAGISQSTLDATEESIKALGITTQAARIIMARFIGAKLDLANATDIARAAQDLAVIGMVDSSEAATDLSYALIAMQPRLLRKYGLYVNLNDAYAKAAEALGKEVKGLTELEKRHAFLNATLEAAAGYTGTYEAAMTTAGKQMRSFRRYTEELANQFGEHFLPIFNEAISVATEFAKWLLAMPEPTKKTAAEILAFGTIMTGAVAAAGALTLALPLLASAIAFLTGPVGLIAVAIGALAAAWIMDFGGIREKTSIVVERIKIAFADLRMGIEALMFNMKDDIERIKTFFVDLRLKLEVFIYNLPNYIEDIKKWFRELPDTILEAVKRIGTSIINGIRQGLASAWPQLKKDVEDIANAIVEAFKEMIGFGSPSRVFAEIGASMRQGLLQGFAGDFGNLIQSFQTGGIVPGCGPRLAMVHGGETVIPAGRGGMVIEVPVYLDGREIARVISPHLADELARQGVRT